MTDATMKDAFELFGRRAELYIRGAQQSKHPEQAVTFIARQITADARVLVEHGPDEYLAHMVRATKRMRQLTALAQQVTQEGTHR